MTAFYVALAFITGATLRDLTCAWLVTRGHMTITLRRKPAPRTTQPKETTNG